jgi:hypothetical protein
MMRVLVRKYKGLLAKLNSDQVGAGLRVTPDQVPLLPKLLEHFAHSSDYAMPADWIFTLIAVASINFNLIFNLNVFVMYLKLVSSDKALD